MHMDVPAPSSERQSATIWVIALAAFWLASAVGGLYIIWAYENGPGVAATAGPQWPGDTSLIAATDRPTLVFLAHPQCTCTTASLGELAEALARAKRAAKDLRRVPEAVVDARRLGEDRALACGGGAARTPPSFAMKTAARRSDLAPSRRAQTLLYDANGSLLFNGGITGSRGHAGDNAGRAAIVDLLNHVSPATTATKVFGCSLFASAKS